MKALHDRLVEGGVTIGVRPERWEYGEGECMNFIMFHDPDGNYLGLIEVLRPR